MEIERKFLCNIRNDLNQFQSIRLSQSYISTDPVIRLRKSNDTYFLTVKGVGAICREEFDLEISESQYLKLLKKAETKTIHKKRVLIPIEDEYVAELDIYDTFLSGLITVEVEFDTQEDAKQFIPPDWFGKEITWDNRYKNSNLCQFGIPKD